jgi:hypothetical protein
MPAHERLKNRLVECMRHHMLVEQANGMGERQAWESAYAATKELFEGQPYSVRKLGRPKK